MSDIIGELGECNSSILVFVHFVDHLVKLFLANEVASRLDHSSKFEGGNGSISIEVKGVESLISIESWLGSKSLSKGLSGIFASDVGSPHALEFVSSVGEEHVISSNDSWHVVGSSSGNHGGIVAIVGNEHLLELADRESSVSRGIVSCDEKIALVIGWVDANGIESSLKLVNINSSISRLVKDLESINDVEVRLMGELDLGVFNFLLKVANLLQGVNELVLLVEWKNWLS